MSRLAKPIYLDYQATTPLDPLVAEAMGPYWSDQFGNPHSEGHPYGWETRRALELARSQVADFIGADDDEVTFVSSATESCNLAIRGLAVSDSFPGRRRIVTLATEHAAVLETALSLAHEDSPVEVLPVEPSGLLRLAKLRSALTEDTLLVSAMLVNNEIGVIQPLRQISAASQEVGAFVHTDATQAAGRIGIDVDDLAVDLLSLSAHKVYGPKGIGALFVRNRPDLRLSPIITGGNQERGLRAGTVPVPLVVGMGKACEIANANLRQEASRVQRLGDLVMAQIRHEYPDSTIFGDGTRRVPGNLSFGVPGVRGDHLVEALSSKVAISTGAACSSSSLEPSRVLLALGFQPEVAETGVRVSIGRFTTLDDALHASRAICATLRQIMRSGNGR